MTLIAVLSAKGAPGVTTLTVALAALGGPDAVAADLDPFGGDIALRYRRDDGRPLDPDVGLLSLGAAIRRGDRGGPGDSTALTGHVQRASGGLAVLAGISRPEQMAGLGLLWPHVVTVLRNGGTVFADCGRAGPASAVLPVVTAADAVLVLARAELEELAHLRERLRFLIGLMPSSSMSSSRIGVVLVTGERDRAAVERGQQLLASAGLNVPVVGRIADDPTGAAILRGTRNGRPGRTLLVRSARSLLPAVAELAGRAAADDAGVVLGRTPPAGAPRPAPQSSPAAPHVSPAAPQSSPAAPHVSPAAPQSSPAAPHVSPAAPQSSPVANTSLPALPPSADAETPPRGMGLPVPSAYPGPGSYPVPDGGR